MLQENNKIMFVFAGPNGSGKSSVIETAKEKNQLPEDYICPDNFVPVGLRHDKNAFIAAANLADILRNAEISNGNSFAFETVLSNPDKLNFIRYAKANGYYVYVVYVTTSTPEINIARVKSRVEQGGHDVPEDKIISRYYRTMELMFDVVQEADRADIFDNSGDKPQLTAMKIAGVYYSRENPPDWIDKYLLSKVKKSNENHKIKYFTK